MTAAGPGPSFESTWSLFVVLGEDQVAGPLSLEHRQLIQEAFLEFTSGTHQVATLFDVGEPVETDPHRLLGVLVVQLRRLVADSSTLADSLRYTRALDLLEAVRGTTR